MYVLCFTRPRIKVSVFRTIGSLVDIDIAVFPNISYYCQPCGMPTIECIITSLSEIPIVSKDFTKSVLNQFG